MWLCDFRVPPCSTHPNPIPPIGSSSLFGETETAPADEQNADYVCDSQAWPSRMSALISSITLAGGIPTPPKNMKVNWDDYSQYMET